MTRETASVAVLDKGCPIATARIAAEVKGGNITTGDPGSGQPNITHYKVTIDGRIYDGEWNDDARYPIMVTIDRSDELAESIIRLATFQEARRDRKTWRAPARGWAKDDIAEYEYGLDRRLEAAKRAVAADPVAVRLVPTLVKARLAD